MDNGSLPQLCSAATLAKTLLEAWLSGDRFRLRAETEYISLLPGSFADDDEEDIASLVRDIARSLNDSQNALLSEDSGNPALQSVRRETWLNLLGHLSARETMPVEAEEPEKFPYDLMAFRSECHSGRYWPPTLR